MAPSSTFPDGGPRVLVGTGWGWGGAASGRAECSVLPHSLRGAGRNPGTRRGLGRRAGRATRSVPLLLKMQKLRPREGVTFPRSHSKTISRGTPGTSPLLPVQCESGHSQMLRFRDPRSIRGRVFAFCLETENQDPHSSPPGWASRWSGPSPQRRGNHSPG